MFSNIWTEIYNIIYWLIDTTTLSAVYNYDVKTYNSFPTATIWVIEWEEIFLDTGNNSDNLIFKIKVVDQNKNIDTMEARMRLLADNILWELRKRENQTLNNTVCKITFSINWGWIDDEQPMRVFEILCRTTSINLI
jgi:hypothetical protein